MEIGYSVRAQSRRPTVGSEYTSVTRPLSVDTIFFVSEPVSVSVINLVYIPTMRSVNKDIMRSVNKDIWK